MIFQFAVKFNGEKSELIYRFGEQETQTIEFDAKKHRDDMGFYSFNIDNAPRAKKETYGKLSEEDKEDIIRNLRFPYRGIVKDLAEKYGVSYGCIHSYKKKVDAGGSVSYEDIMLK